VQNELFDVCSDRDPNPAEQRKQLITLLKAGADIHATDKNGVTALHHAVSFRSPAAVKTLIEFGANVNQACRRNGSTPLHRATTQTGAPGTAGRGPAAREIIELLLAAGADPSLKNKLGKRPTDYVTDDAMRSLFDNCVLKPTNRHGKV
jgi:tankyrase